MIYSRGLPPQFEPSAVREEPLTAERFMALLDDYVYAVASPGPAKTERAALATAVDELFRRLAT